MGLFDDFSDIFAGISELSDEIKGIKDDIVTSVMQPAQDLRDTVSDITSSVSNSDASTIISAVTKINVTDGSDATN